MKSCGKSFYICELILLVGKRHEEDSCIYPEPIEKMNWLNQLTMENYDPFRGNLRENVEKRRNKLHEKQLCAKLEGRMWILRR